jgi:hypothetical protein
MVIFNFERIFMNDPRRLIPLDGGVIKVMNAKPVDPDTMGWTAFTKLRFKPGDYQHVIPIQKLAT